MKTIDLNSETNIGPSPDTADNSALGAPHSALDASRRSTAKIARLPSHIRQLLNTLLHEGHTYDQIIARLNELGHPGISRQNISLWRQRSFRHWLLQQERLDQIKAESEAIADALHNRDQSVTLDEANDLFLTSHFHRLLLTLESTFVKRYLARNPLKFFELAKAVIAQAHARTRRKRANLAERKYDDKLAKEKHLQQSEQPSAIPNQPSEKQRRLIIEIVDEIMGTKRHRPPTDAADTPPSVSNPPSNNPSIRIPSQI